MSPKVIEFPMEPLRFGVGLGSRSYIYSLVDLSQHEVGRTLQTVKDWDFSTFKVSVYQRT